MGKKADVVIHAAIDPSSKTAGSTGTFAEALPASM